MVQTWHTIACTLDGNIQEESGAAAFMGASAIRIREGRHLASLKINRELMVSTVGVVKQSKNASHRRRLPFPFDPEPNIMNDFGGMQQNFVGF